MKLTPRQTEILQSLADGHTQHETAEIMGVSRMTIKNQLHKARAKNGALNTAHLVAMAYAAGAIV